MPSHDYITEAFAVMDERLASIRESSKEYTQSQEVFTEQLNALFRSTIDP